MAGRRTVRRGHDVRQAVSRAYRLVVIGLRQTVMTISLCQGCPVSGCCKREARGQVTAIPLGRQVGLQQPRVIIGGRRALRPSPRKGRFR